MKATIAVISFSRVASDNRVLKSLRALNGKSVLLVGLGPKPEGFEGRYRRLDAAQSDRRLRTTRPPSSVFRLLRKSPAYSGFYFSSPLVRELLEVRKDFAGIRDFYVHEIEPLPALTSTVAKNENVRIVVDLHEFAFDEEETLLHRRILGPYKSNFMWTSLGSPGIVGVVSATERLGQMVHEQFSLPYSVSTNAASSAELVFSAPNLAPDQLRLVSHGAARFGSRYLGLILAVAVAKISMKYITLDLILVPKSALYLKLVSAISAPLPGINLLKPIPRRRLFSVLSEYDFGIFFHHGTTTNALYCLPNRYFDFLAAGIPCLSTPNPDLAREIIESGSGSVSDGFSISSMIALIRQVSSTRSRVWANTCAKHAALRAWDQSELPRLREFLGNRFK